MILNDFSKGKSKDNCFLVDAKNYLKHFLSFEGRRKFCFFYHFLKVGDQNLTSKREYLNLQEPQK